MSTPENLSHTLSAIEAAQPRTGRHGQPRWWRLLISIDQFFNVLVFNGHPDETMSSNFAKSRARGRRLGCVMCRFLDLFDRDHCTKALELDEGKPL